MTSKRSIAPALALAACLVGTSATAGVYMKMEPERKGSVQAVDHVDWINLLAVSGSFTKAACSDLSVLKGVDTASTQLIADTVTGNNFSKIEIHVTQPGREPGQEDVLFQFTLEPSPSADRERGFLKMSFLSTSFDPVSGGANKTDVVH